MVHNLLVDNLGLPKSLHCVVLWAPVHIALEVPEFYGPYHVVLHCSTTLNCVLVD